MHRLLLWIPLTVACASPARPTLPAVTLPTGGVHDFDYFEGGWTTAQRRLKVRGVGSTDWDEFPGTLCMRPYLGGMVTVDELAFPTKGWSGLTVRAFDHAQQRWAVYWINSKTGTVGTPVRGGFSGERGEFYGEDEDGGHPVRVRYRWHKVDRDHARWEQAFSRDGATWETNWTADFTRTDAATACSAGRPRAEASASLLAPGVVSGPLNDLNAAFAPGGDELYFARKDAADKVATILVTRRRGDRWSEPQAAPFSGRYSDVDPMFSPDGTRLYFSSYRPREPGATAPAADADIWFVERRAGGGGFGEPVHVGAPVSTAADDLYPSLTRDGALYYARWDAGAGTGDLFRARQVGAGYEVERLPAPVNTDAAEYDPYVSPDERYLVFASSRPGGLGGADLYVSTRTGAGWSEPRNLGPPINSVARDYAPVVSPDGQQLLFTSKRPDAPDGGRGNVYGVPAASLLLPR